MKRRFQEERRTNIIEFDKNTRACPLAVFFRARVIKHTEALWGVTFS